MAYSALQVTSARPFLKWAGGKGRLISQYESYFPQYFEAYHEPFLGGGAIFFHLLPKRAILSDINSELVNVYRCVRDSVEDLIEQLLEHQHQHCEEYYYAVRANPRSDEIERAARLLYLNRTCFNGLYRENSQGKFNVPLGKYKDPRVCHPELLRPAAAALQRVQIEVQPFDAIADQVSKRDFVYFDPPYYPISATSSFTAYNRYSFHQVDQIRLRETFGKLAERGVRVMLSNSDCPFIRSLYEGFNIYTIYSSRSINSKAEKRGKITEVLITSY
jgi:DNA adenine methylase